MASTSASNITPAARLFGLGMPPLYQIQPQPVRLAVWITQGGLRTSEVPASRRRDRAGLQVDRVAVAPPPGFVHVVFYRPRYSQVIALPNALA